jgi:hypothetical protein
MLDGVKILIERMDQDPDKFSRNYRLCDLVGQVVGDSEHVNYTKEERDAILDAHRRMMRKNFTAGVLENLDFKEEQITLPYTTATKGTTPPTLTVNSMPSPNIVLGKVQLTEKHLEIIKRKAGITC